MAGTFGPRVLVIGLEAEPVDAVVLYAFRRQLDQLAVAMLALAASGEIGQAEGVEFAPRLVVVGQAGVGD